MINFARELEVKHEAKHMTKHWAKHEMEHNGGEDAVLRRAWFKVLLRLAPVKGAAAGSGQVLRRAQPTIQYITRYASLIRRWHGLVKATPLPPSAICLTPLFPPEAQKLI